MNKQDQIEIYQSKEGTTEIRVHFEQETVWLTQAQMVELFGRDQSVISRHIKNALDEKELDEKSNMQKMHIANSDRPVKPIGKQINIVFKEGELQKPAIVENFATTAADGSAYQNEL